MSYEVQKTAVKQLRLVTYLSIFVNVLILIPVKFTVGFLTGSLSLVADGIHSVSDMITDFIVLFGLYFGSKEPDHNHNYGHGKLETLAAAAISFFLLAVGLAMIHYAAHDIIKGTVKHPSNVVLAAAVLSIAIKEGVYRVTRAAAIKYHCPAALANAWHDRADAFSSLAVVLGVIGLKLGFDHGDQIAAIAVGVMITLVSIKIIGDCVAEFTEQAVDEATIEEIRGLIEAEDQIHSWHHLRTRAIGREIFLDLHIVVAPNLDVATAHSISQRLETSLRNRLTRPVNIVIQVEPDIPQLRK
ncbi:MAG: cation diffusion facilitator family transporter [Sedimentisphaerales bacterium]|jgi:cation diffusion facilitator family transporter